MRHIALASALALALLLPGCLGSVSPAEVPESSLSNNGWREKGRQSQSVGLGLGELVLIDYVPRSVVAADFASGVTVVTVNDVPFVDERDFIPMALEKLEEERGVRFEEAGTRSIQFTNLGATVTSTEYNVRGAGVPAKALLATPACPDFVVVAAFGVTETGSSGGGLLGGGSSSQNLYNMAIKVAQTVEC